MSKRKRKIVDVPHSTLLNPKKFEKLIDWEHPEVKKLLAAVEKRQKEHGKEDL